MGSISVGLHACDIRCTAADIEAFLGALIP
jgi:hypothetical protein